MKRYCLTLDLKNDPQLIAEYDAHHRAVWPEVLRSIRDSGITAMQIYRLGTRLVMIMETTDAFDFEKKAAADSSNVRVQEWESLMWRYQQALPGSAAGEKWKLMENIFDLNAFQI
jgi:L-rhamnose mutarotase